MKERGKKANLLQVRFSVFHWIPFSKYETSFLEPLFLVLLNLFSPPLLFQYNDFYSLPEKKILLFSSALQLYASASPLLLCTLSSFISSRYQLGTMWCCTCWQAVPMLIARTPCLIDQVPHAEWTLHSQLSLSFLLKEISFPDMCLGLQTYIYNLYHSSFWVPRK